MSLEMNRQKRIAERRVIGWGGGSRKKTIRSRRRQIKGSCFTPIYTYCFHQTFFLISPFFLSFFICFVLLCFSSHSCQVFWPWYGSLMVWCNYFYRYLTNPYFNFGMSVCLFVYVFLCSRYFVSTMQVINV